MNKHPELTQISQITRNIFLSGIYPLEDNNDLIKKLNIKYILSCVDRNYISDVHDKLMIQNPELTILYLPYNDDISQNLWLSNRDSIKMVKYTKNGNDFDKLLKLLQIYKNKPLIEIGYHFIDNAVEQNNNVLVHCMAGVSRSVSLILYYLMKKYHMNFDKALSIVKHERSIAHPNNSFRLQLKKYQNKRQHFTEKDANHTISELS